MVAELLAQARVGVDEVYALEDWLSSQTANLPPQSFAVTDADLKQVSSLTTPNRALAVASFPPLSVDRERLCGDYSLFLDGIRDPGNLGTILRIADWFAVPYVFCSPDCADLFNAKVIQASMGAVLRVHAFEMPLEQVLGHCSPGWPVIGAALEGENLFETALPGHGLIIIGSEARGISSETEARLSMKVRIPRPPAGRAESLNAAVAAGIICAVARK